MSKLFIYTDGAIFIRTKADLTSYGFVKVEVGSPVHDAALRYFVANGFKI